MQSAHPSCWRFSCACKRLSSSDASSSSPENISTAAATARAVLPSSCSTGPPLRCGLRRGDSSPAVELPLPGSAMAAAAPAASAPAATSSSLLASDLNAGVTRRRREAS